MVEFFLSERDGRKFALDGYIYNLEREYPTHSCWFCEKRHSKEDSCKARVVLNNGEVSIKVEHNHDADYFYVEKRILLNKLYKQAEISKDPPSKLINDAMVDATEACKAVLPSKEVMTANICRRRRMLLPERPTTSSDEPKERPIVGTYPKKAAHFFLSKRSRGKMALDGYIFNLEREYATYSNWYCENRHATPEKCRARAVLQDDEISVKVGHNHDSDQPSVEKRIVLSKLYKQAESSVEAPSNLIAEVLEGVSDEVKKSLPSKEVMAASISRKRRLAHKDDQKELDNTEIFDSELDLVNVINKLIKEEQP
uniref:FLYWCH-type domain-containing protein n=1 Tax=Acrobeloides nanus TaxID=290746 RepID=A0A914D3E5_9BILA